MVHQKKGGIASQVRPDSGAKSQKAPTLPTRPVIANSLQTTEREKPIEGSGYRPPPGADWALVFVTAILAIYTFRLFRATKELADGASKDAERVRDVMGKQQAAMEAQAG